MIIDAHNQFSDAQAVTASAVGTNVIDLGVNRSIGSGEPMGVVFVVTVAADQTTGDEDYTFDIEYATNAAQSTGVQLAGRRIFESGTPTAPAQNADLLVAGFKFAIALPPGDTAETGQYLGIRYVTAGTTPTITVTSYLAPLCMIDSSTIYADGFAIT